MTAATVHYLPSARDGEDQDHAADVAALVAELGMLAGQLADARVELDAMRAAFGPRSDERDQWQRRALAGWADGYRAGFEAGAEVGAARAAEAWKITATNTGWHDVSQHGQSWADLDRRRYPPHGRLSWIIPNLGETWAAWSALDSDGGQL